MEEEKASFPHTASLDTVRVKYRKGTSIWTEFDSCNAEDYSFIVFVVVVLYLLAVYNIL